VRRGLTALAVLVSAGCIGGTAAAASPQQRHKPKPSGIKGVVLDETCTTGDCRTPPSAYAGSITITVTRPSDGRQVASRTTTDGKFRLRVKRGLYDVTAAAPTPPACEPTPETVCPLDASQPAVIVRPCVEGETKQVRVRRHRMTRVELNVQNVCVV
jgi:hypothetical protein